MGSPHESQIRALKRPIFERNLIRKLSRPKRAKFQDPSRTQAGIQAGNSPRGAAFWPGSGGVLSGFSGRGSPAGLESLGPAGNN